MAGVSSVTVFLLVLSIQNIQDEWVEVKEVFGFFLSVGRVPVRGDGAGVKIAESGNAW